jgi:cytochrome c
MRRRNEALNHATAHGGPSVRMLAAILLACAASSLLGAPVAAETAPGEAVFKNNCGTCHVVSAAPAQRQGPNLFGVIGRPAGTVKGFHYSKALAKAKFIWSKEQLDAWLTDSAKLVPGSLMNYRQGDPAVRIAIIDYLASASGAQ